MNKELISKLKTFLQCKIYIFFFKIFSSHFNQNLKSFGQGNVDEKKKKIGQIIHHKFEEKPENAKPFQFLSKIVRPKH